MKLELYYSNHCEGSKRIARLFKQFPQLHQAVQLKCIDKYYYETKRFPDGVRGTPTIFNEENDKIKVYEGQSAFDLLKKIMNDFTKDSSSNLPPSGIPVGGVSINPAQNISRPTEESKKIEGAEVSVSGGVSIKTMTTLNTDWFDESKLPTDEKTAQSTVNPFAINVKEVYKDKMSETDTRQSLAQIEEARKAYDNNLKNNLSKTKVVPHPNPFAKHV
jgi:hypothetical protein